MTTTVPAPRKSAETHTHPLHELAEALFVSPLQESEHPTHQQVKDAVEATLVACDGDCRQCAACLAQEAGDHPETFVQRMKWCLVEVAAVYGPSTLGGAA